MVAVAVQAFAMQLPLKLVEQVAEEFQVAEVAAQKQVALRPMQQVAQAVKV
jgi:hypothetical protein